MYKFGDIVLYEAKNETKIPFVVVSDIDGILFGYALKKPMHVTKNIEERYIKIPKVSINKNEYTYIDTKNSLSIKSLYVIDENKFLDINSSNNLRNKLNMLSDSDELRDGIMENIELCDRIVSFSTRLEPLSSDYHMLTMDDVFPNGTGRTEEQFKEDTKHLPKKYLLKYYEMKDKQQ